VFAAVTGEAGRLLFADYATMARYDPVDVIRVVAAWSRSGPAFPLGTRWQADGQNVPTLVLQTGRSARMDNYASASGQVADAVREFGFRASAGVPVSVEGRLQGVMMLASGREPWPAGTEAQLAGFTDLAATAQARVELRGFADEQAALRRVATLVAHAAPPAEVLTAVTKEAGRLLHAGNAAMSRYDTDGARTVVASWDSSGIAFPVGTRARLGPGRPHRPGRSTRRPPRSLQPARRGDDAGGHSAPRRAKWIVMSAAISTVSGRTCMIGDIPARAPRSAVRDMGRRSIDGRRSREHSSSGVARSRSAEHQRTTQTA